MDADADEFYDAYDNTSENRSPNDIFILVKPAELCNPCLAFGIGVMLVHWKENHT
jgi:hypothetical protein